LIYHLSMNFDKFKLFSIAAACVSFSTVAQAPLDVRVALVIGNAAYQNVPALANSTNDAKSMATVLRKLGFGVVEIVDGSKDQMSKAIDQMQGMLKGKQAVGMLYYAGHGLQLDWHNYMVPVDAKLNQAVDVPKQTIDIENVIDTFKRSATRMNIIVLDACRDNPFAGKASGKGLAQLDAPPGTYLAFATSPGNVAEDGDETSGNGLFTQFLLKELQKPARIEDVFKRVRLQVRQKSQGRQIPWDSSSLEDDFAFNDGAKHTFNPDDLLKEAQLAKEKEAKFKQEAQAALERERQIAEQQALEKQKLVELQKQQETKARQKAEAEAKERERLLALAFEQEKQKALAAAQALERIKAEELQRLKDIEQAKLQAQEEAKRNKLSQEAAKEQQFAQEKSDWDKIKDSTNADDFYAYLNKYPNGLISQQANFKLETLAKAKITMQADKNGIVQKLGEPRYRLGDRWIGVRRNDYNGAIMARGEIKVDRIEAGYVYASSNTGLNYVYTLDGAVLRSNTADNTFTYDPPLTAQPGDELSVGKKWTNATNETNKFGTNFRTDEYKVLALEDLTIPAGTFKAYKIQIKGWSGNNRIDNLTWVLPDWGVPLKTIRRVYHARGAPTMETVELESFVRGSVPQSTQKMAAK
jgi:uncharacterized caspase-like protein